MAIVRTVSRDELAHSFIERGVVQFGPKDRREVPFEFETPHEPASDDFFSLETGLTAGLESLVCARGRIAELGYRAVAVGHLHHNVLNPIRANAEDIQAVNEAFAGEAAIHGVGLSRGWPAQVLVARHQSVESLSAVAPAMMSRVNLFRLGLLPAEVAIETIRNPKVFGAVVRDCMREVVTRPDITLAEFMKLLIGDIHHRVEDVKKLDPKIKLHMYAFARDCFFEARDLRLVARKLGFHTATVVKKGTAGHGALSYDETTVDRVVSNAVGGASTVRQAA